MFDGFIEIYCLVDGNWSGEKSRCVGEKYLLFIWLFEWVSFFYENVCFKILCFLKNLNNIDSYCYIVELRFKFWLFDIKVYVYNYN